MPARTLNDFFAGFFYAGIIEPGRRLAWSLHIKVKGMVMWKKSTL